MDVRLFGRPASGSPVDKYTIGFEWIEPPTRAWRTKTVASVKDRVIDIVADQLGVNKDQVTRETHFVNDLGADSLDTVELVMELEEEFEISIPEDAAEKIQTVGQAIDFIEKVQAS